MSDRLSRYREQRDHWREVALDAVAALLVVHGDDLGLLDQDPQERDIARQRAEELAATVFDRRAQ
ncbi:MAG: hypothetical protein J2P22_20175 [Nocardioides sp.]|nr:hypothetical protein [Nocardioides sp.]